jgi:crotonobetainyl-CoA:carnitine CoA-transferase CaiB-like acyl-CoA transferase
VPRRSAGGARVGNVQLRFVYPTADDGFVSITHVFGPVIGPMTARLMDWVCEEGFCTPAMRDKDWVNYELLLESGEESIAGWEAVKAAVEAFTSSHTKAELMTGAMERRVVMAPIATPRDVAESAQFGARGFFDKVEHREAGRYVLAPGPFARCATRPLCSLGPAPKVGEHTEEVLAEAPRRPAVSTPPEPTSSADLPLSGLKVLDFTWSIAGPHSVRVLADYGATVVKVETSHRLDGARGYRPVVDNIQGLENSTLFDDMNVGKLSLALDLSSPEGRAVALDLVRWADVVIESYSPKAMKAWGMAWDDLRQVRPDLVMVSTCLNGQTGPLAQFAGFGNLAAAMSGFYGLCGWPDRPPAGPFGAYTDYTATHVLLVAVLAAVDHRRRTGEGLYVDMAQAEAAMHFLTPALLDWTVNGRIAGRVGNRDLDMAPHGVYPSAGDDRWVAIACQDDNAWQALHAEMGRADLGVRAELATGEGRLAHQDELDAAVAAWTSALTGAEVEQRLQARGVAAHVVATSDDCVADPQLHHRGHFVELEHPNRFCLVEGSRTRLSRTPARVDRCAPTLGQHTAHILQDLLGYEPQRVVELSAAGVLE